MTKIRLHPPIVVLAAVLASGTALAQPAAVVVRAPPRPEIPLDIIDLSGERDQLKSERKEAYERLKREGRATAGEFRKVDEGLREKARAAETRRTKALQDLSEKTGGIKIEQGTGGTKPQDGRGIMGDIDTNSLDGKDFGKVRDALGNIVDPKTGKKYTVVGDGDSFTIKELDVTVHRKSASQSRFGSAETPGSSGHVAETMRGNNPETALGFGQADPAISVTDNLKKAADTLSKPASTIEMEDLQKLGKMTERNVQEIGKAARPGETPKIDPRLRDQAQMLKDGFSPEAAGIVRDNATPEQRAQDIADFQAKSREVSVEAVKAADRFANTRMEELAAEARHANEVLEKTIETGDAQRIETARKNAAAAESKVIGYQEMRSVAQEAAVMASPETTVIVSEARGVKTEGRTPSQVREVLVAPERAAVTRVVAEPTRAPGTSASAAAAPHGSSRATAVKGAGIIMDVVNAVQSVQRAAEEAGKEAAEKGDSTLVSVAKTGAYSAWYGVGIGGAIETGRKAGEESAKQWAEDVKAGKVDPTSKLSQAWAHLRGVGWGLAEFTGLQTVKDAVTEGAGLVKDRYTQYEAEKAAAEQKKAGPGPTLTPVKPVTPVAPVTGPVQQPAPVTTRPVAPKPVEPVKPVAAPKPQPVQPAPITAAPPPPTTTEVEGGWLKDKNGTTKVIYINDSKGNRIGGYYIRYDASMKEIGRENFTVTPDAPVPATVLAGAYRGRISGQSTGSISFTVTGTQVSGSIGGTYQGDTYSATFATGIGANGTFSGGIQGVLNGKMGDGSIQRYSFTGTIQGRIGEAGATGSWAAHNQYGNAKGNWQAGK